MNKIAIIYTTFLRPELVKQTLSTLINNTNLNTIILVGDQGYDSDNIKSICGNLNSSKIIYNKLPFDCGLSAGRNKLIQIAENMGISYCIITADSIEFIKNYNFDIIIDFLNSNKYYGTVGFDLQNRICWECDIELIKNQRFYLDIPRKDIITYKGISFQEVDLHRNFFIAKTESLINTTWDEKLKMLEHEDHAYRWKHNTTHYKRFYTNHIVGEYIDYKPQEYNKYRSRMQSEFMTILRKKYNITGWVGYSKELKQKFNEYKYGKFK